MKKVNGELSVRTLDEGVKKATLGEINKDGGDMFPVTKNAQQTMIDVLAGSQAAKQAQDVIMTDS